MNLGVVLLLIGVFWGGQLACEIRYWGRRALTFPQVTVLP